MFYLEQESVGLVDNYNIYAGKCSDCVDIWDLIEADDKNNFFSDFDEVNNKKDFKRFLDQAVYDICTVRDEGQIIYAFWIVISGWKSFYYCGIAKEKYRNIKLTKKVNDIVLNYFKSKYEVNRFDALVNENNRVSRLAIRRVGFVCLGLIPKLYLNEGLETGYYKYYLEV